jgi:MarR family transcriptional regulator for hemolysin
MQPDLRHTLGRLIGQAARQWRRAVDARLQPFGLTEASWLPLLHLSRAGVPMRQKDLAASLVLDSSSVVRLLDGLQVAGFIERREEPSDRRVRSIHLTALGRATVEQVEDVARQVRAGTLAGLTDAEIEAASRVLRHVCEALAEGERA